MRDGGEADVTDDGDVDDDAAVLAVVVGAAVPTPAARTDVDGDAAASVTLFVLVAASAASTAVAAAVLSGALGWPSSGDGAILERGGRCGAVGLQRCGVLGLSTATGRHARTHSHSLTRTAPGCCWSAAMRWATSRFGFIAITPGTARQRRRSGVTHFSIGVCCC